MSEVPDIITGITRPDLFTAFKYQLKKDFENCGLKSDFADGLIADYDLIFSIVSKEINLILKTGGKLNELLYRIDISEPQIKKLSKEKTNTDLNEVLAELIIKRELQKVVIKEFYKKKE